MSGELRVFENEAFGNVRVVEQNGEPWFVAKDVAEVLGYANPHDAIRSHCKGVSEVRTPTGGGEQVVKVIPERDIYRLVMRSKLPEAEKFEEWVVGDVLPAIRKHGMYATPATVETMLHDPKAFRALLDSYIEEQEKRLEAEKRVAILSHVNKSYVATEIAKEAGFKSAIELNKWLHDKGVQYKVNDTWVLYSKYAGYGYDIVKQDVLDNGKVIYHRRWTQLGREWILGLVEEGKA